MNPIRSALRHRQVIIVVMAMAALLGVHALLDMPRREDPKITIRAGLVLARYPGATAEQVEAQVARKIEQKLFSYAEVRKAKTYSTSRPGDLIVNVTLEESVNNPEQFWAQLRHDMNELRERELPSGVQGPIVNSNFGDVVAVLLSVRGDRYTSRELTDYLDRIEDQLRTIPEVSKINRYGEQREQLQVTASAARISQYGITAQSVIQTLQARNEVVEGGAVKVEGSRVAMRPTGLFATEEQLRRMLVGGGPAGQSVRLGDFATVERRFQDPAFLVRVNSGDAVLMSIEMQHGKNVVSFGKAIQHTIADLRATLPPDLKIDLIADQPAMVQERVDDFGHEFSIAIVSVILVTVLLLPFRVAAIAAVAIPVTVCVTLAVLAAIGVELHQISFAGLVVALGMVVDDAIVIADNYVEQLDHGVARSEAAWKCASDLAVPVLAATLTIVASFMPLAILLPGTTGEFMRPLPITVTVALLSSYAVAMLLTPVLCLAFIKTGLRPHVADHSEAPPKPSRLPAWVRAIRPLDAMQTVYERAMAWALPRKWTTIAIGAASFFIAILLLDKIPQQYFPFAERNQFVIDVWLPEGSRIEATDATMRKLERELARTHGVLVYAAFVGAGSPRFYYNVNPESQTANYGQFVINTTSADETPQLVEELRGRLGALAPEARVYLKELQQGASFPSPVEVRLSGDDMLALRMW